MHILCSVGLVAFFLLFSFRSFVVGFWSFGSSFIREMYVALAWFVLYLGFLWDSSCCLFSAGWGFSHTRLQFFSLVALICSGFDVCPDDRGDSYCSDLFHLVRAVLFRV